MTDHEEFFDKVGEFNIKTMYYDVEWCFTVEELYQAFKSRMIAEIQSEVESKLLDMLGASIDEDS